MFRTTASARTMPPGTSKTRVRSAPTLSVMGPQRNRPPMLNVLTRETCCWPLPYQVTDMPCGSEIRWWRRCVPQGVSVVITQGKGTSSIGREPIEQKFLSASTFVTAPRPGKRGYRQVPSLFPAGRRTRVEWRHEVCRVHGGEGRRERGPRAVVPGRLTSLWGLHLPGDSTLHDV
jgi:hypothetical protein